MDVATGGPNPIIMECDLHRHLWHPVEHRRHQASNNHGQTPDSSTRYSLTYPSRIEGPRELSKSCEGANIRDGPRHKESVNCETARGGTLQCNVPTYMKDNGQMRRQECINMDRHGPMWKRWERYIRRRLMGDIPHWSAQRHLQWPQWIEASDLTESDRDGNWSMAVRYQRSTRRRDGDLAWGIPTVHNRLNRNQDGTYMSTGTHRRCSRTDTGTTCIYLMIN